MHPARMLFSVVLATAVIAVTAALWRREAPPLAGNAEASANEAMASGRNGAEGLGSDTPAPETALDWVERANRSETWPLPVALRLPGGPAEVALAASPEEWVQRLPERQQALARTFLARNDDAYAFSSKAELAWLIENGFPALEEVVYFASLPREATCVQTIASLRAGAADTGAPPPCPNPKMAMLSADAQIEAAEHLLASKGGASPTVVLDGTLSVSTEAMEALELITRTRRLAEEGVGAYRFYQLAALERLPLGAPRSTSDPAHRETISLALAYACEGDERLWRLRSPEFWSRPASIAVVAALNLLGPDLRRADGRPVCGFSRQLAYPTGP